MVRNYLLFATLALGAMLAEQATAQSGTQVWTLSCRVDPNIGFIIVGHQPMQCVYTQAPNAIPQVPPQSYEPFVVSGKAAYDNGCANSGVWRRCSGDVGSPTAACVACKAISCSEFA